MDKFKKNKCIAKSVDELAFDSFSTWENDIPEDLYIVDDVFMTKARMNKLVELAYCRGYVIAKTKG
jgi:hypothetical protein